MDLADDSSSHSHWAKVALQDTEQKVYWTDVQHSTSNNPYLKGSQKADLVIIGAGFTGLWAALQASEENPGRTIIVLEAHEVGFGASTRNGGFCSASITHGIFNGLAHWQNDYPRLHQMGRENIQGILNTLDRYTIDAAVEQNGLIEFALAEWHIDDLLELQELYQHYGDKAVFLDQKEAQAEVNSPTYLGGLKIEDHTLLVNPAKLVEGLKEACVQNGVQFFDHSRVMEIETNKRDLLVYTKSGLVKTEKAVIATNAWAEPDKKMRKYVIPVYEYVLVTEPLSAAQLKSIGWENREGLSDGAHLFHYYRLTEDNRILWGGYDAIYFPNNTMGFKCEQVDTIFNLLAPQFFQTFPQLEGLRFTHKWAGPIGTTSKFTAAFGTTNKGNVAWAAGYTGLGVGASRFGARVTLDLIDGLNTERTNLEMVRQKPMQFPPEPFRNLIIKYTQKQIAQSDQNGGRRGLWLRFLDRIGVGFDS